MSSHVEVRLPVFLLCYGKVIWDYLRLIRLCV